jgi:hypothetical protein
VLAGIVVISRHDARAYAGNRKIYRFLLILLGGVLAITYIPALTTILLR